MFGDFRKASVHGHEANELEAFMTSIEHRKLETIHYFYHVTGSGTIHKILTDGMLLKRKTDSPFWTKLAKDEDSPEGVWFCASLYDSELPVHSTYGESRLKIPCQHVISNMLKPRLYLESFYYFESNPRNQVVRLVLVDADKQRKENEWCEKNCLRRLNMKDNKVLVFNEDKNDYKTLANNSALPNYWVEILVVGNVATVAIDTIIETPPSKLDPIPGKVPPLL
ncbi:hypothetical protein ACF0H5_017854 [Mactra antiquata]